MAVLVLIIINTCASISVLKEGVKRPKSPPGKALPLNLEYLHKKLPSRAPSYRFRSSKFEGVQYYTQLYHLHITFK